MAAGTTASPSVGPATSPPVIPAATERATALRAMPAFASAPLPIQAATEISPRTSTHAGYCPALRIMAIADGDAPGQC